MTYRTHLDGAWGGLSAYFLRRLMNRITIHAGELRRKDPELAERLMADLRDIAETVAYLDEERGSMR